MEIIKPDPRKCVICETVKEHRAYVGYREVCRSCWLDVPEKDKARFQRNEQNLIASRKYRQKKASEFRRRLLSESQLNVEVLK